MVALVMMPIYDESCPQMDMAEILSQLAYSAMTRQQVLTSPWDGITLEQSRPSVVSPGASMLQPPHIFKLQAEYFETTILITL